MIQNPKGWGLSSAFGGGNQIMGARKTSDFLEKTTWTLAIVLVSLALLSNFAIPRNSSDEDSIINIDEQNDESIEDFDIENIDDAYALRDFKKNNPDLFDLTKISVDSYTTINDIYEIRQIQLNQQGV